MPDLPNHLEYSKTSRKRAGAEVLLNAKLRLIYTCLTRLSLRGVAVSDTNEARDTAISVNVLFHYNCFTYSATWRLGFSAAPNPLHMCAF